MRDLDVRGMAGHRLVDRVVDDLPHEVMQAADVGRADVHARPTPDGLEALEDLDGVGAVARVPLDVAGRWCAGRWHVLELVGSAALRAHRIVLPVRRSYEAIRSSCVVPGRS